MEKRRKLFIAALTLVLLSAYLAHYERTSAVFGVYLIALGYLTGVLAVLLKTLLFLVALLTSLPLISTLYAYLLLMLGRLHTILFKTVIKKLLARHRFYQELEFRVRNSDFYMTVNHRLRSLTKKGEVKRPTGIRFYEVLPCKNCGKEIPMDSAYCPLCGAELKD